MGSENDAIGDMVDDECTAYCHDYPIARSYGPKLPALLSVLGSYVVIREVLSNNDIRDRSKSIPRLLLAMSISDLFFSIPYIFTTWAMPPHENLYQSSGTITTCSLQGAFLQFGVSTSPLFNVAISLTALWMIRYNWRRRLVVAEVVLHTAIWTYGLVATIPFWNMYNPTSTACWIASVPHHCGVNETDAIQCIRGEGASFWRVFFAFFPTWPCIVVGMINMVLIYRTVRRMETRNLRYAGRGSITPAMGPATVDVVPGSVTFLPPSSPSPPPRHHHQDELRQSASRRRSRAVAIQAMFYTSSFLLTFSLDTIVLLWNVLTFKANQVLIVCAYILFPMQGFFNAIVYVRTANLQTWEGRWFLHLVFGYWWRPLLRTCTGRAANNEDENSDNDDGDDPTRGHRRSREQAKRSSSSLGPRREGVNGVSSEDELVVSTGEDASHTSLVEEDEEEDFDSTHTTIRSIEDAEVPSANVCSEEVVG